jgi:peptidoglycan/xylan/chitin deacetylase (PgdA/CDA1 family)
MPKRAISAALVTAIFIGLLFLFFFVKQNYVAPILMYHSIVGKNKAANLLEVSARSFQRQAWFLKTWRYKVMPLEDLTRLIRDKKSIPFKAVAITFDDGYKDNYVYAFPILKKYKLPATVFIIYDEVGRPDRLSWREIKEMRDSGLITFGSHTLKHVPLVDINSPEELKRQIFESKKALEEKINRPVDIFCYPVGAFTTPIRQLVIDAGYQAAVATRPREGYPKDDVFTLRRLRISSPCDSLFVFWFETSGIYAHFKERRHD